MSRVVEIELLGRNWPMCLTLGAFREICERYGDLKSCLMRLDKVGGVYEKNDETGEIQVITPEDTNALLEEYTWLLWRLLDGAWQQAVLLHGPGVAGECPPTKTDLLNAFCPGDVPEIQRKVLETIRVGQYREVGAEAPKNEKGPAEG